MLPFDARSAVICDGDKEIRVPHPMALVRMLNRATSVPQDIVYHCPLDTGAHISIVVTGIDRKTKRPAGDIVMLHTSGCGFANATTGEWRLTPAAWVALRKLDAELRS
jgi:hypothetical protein